MSFLKRMFGNKNGDAELRQRFDDEFLRTVHRFKIVAGFESFQFRLLHPETRQPMTPHEGLAGTFEDWKKIQSVWDRRRLIFDVLLEMMGRSMAVWHIARIFTANREPQRALKLLDDNPVAEQNSKEFAAYCAARGNAFIKQQRPAEALEWIRKTSQIEPQNRELKILLADALALSGEWESASPIYTELMQNAAGVQTKADNDISRMFDQMFAVETGAVPSPVLAIEIASRLQNKEQIREFWQQGEAEFYDSPYFRMHHAYYHASQGDFPRALAKLVALVQEIPWLKEANINLLALFEKLDPSGTSLMPDLQKQIRQAIRDNGWTTDGMNPMLINLNRKNNENS
jgi:tetratricopeptide (TPR) repeat protein